MKLLQTLESSFRNMEGYMWKRAPRRTDNDKSNFRRFFTIPAGRNELYKKRYFVLDPSTKTLSYYPDAKRSTLLGGIDLTAVSAVSTEQKPSLEVDSFVPTEHVLNITTSSRLWSFCCITGEEQAAWNQCMQLMIFQNQHSTQHPAGYTLRASGSARPSFSLPPPPSHNVGGGSAAIALPPHGATTLAATSASGSSSSSSVNTHDNVKSAVPVKSVAQKIASIQSQRKLLGTDPATSYDPDDEPALTDLKEQLGRLAAGHGGGGGGNGGGHNAAHDGSSSAASFVTDVAGADALQHPTGNAAFHAAAAVAAENNKQKGGFSNLFKWTSAKEPDKGHGGGGEGGAGAVKKIKKLFNPTFQNTFGGSMEKQNQRVEAWKQAVRTEDKSALFQMGNLPISCLSVIADPDPFSLKFFHTLIEKGVPRARLESFVDRNVRLRFVNEGEVLVKEGDRVSVVYVVLSGEFLRQKNVHGDQYGISVLEAGDVCGFEELQHVGFYVSSVVAGMSSCMYEFDAVALAEFLQSIDKLEAFDEFRLNFVADLLSCVPLLMDLEVSRLRKLAEYFSIHVYEKRQVVFSVDEPAENFIIVMNGTTKATCGNSAESIRLSRVFTKSMSAGLERYTTDFGGGGGGGGGGLEEGAGVGGGTTTQIVGLFSSGDWMNEDSIRQKRNYPVTLTSVSDHTMLLTCTADGFAHVLTLGGETLASNIQKIVSGRLAGAMVKCPLFFGLNALSNKFASFMHFDEVPSGTVVCSQGAICDGFYIVLSGKLDVCIDALAGIPLGHTVVKRTLKLYDFFGADWLLNAGGICFATVKTRSHCILLRTPATSFGELAEMCPTLHQRLLKMNAEQKEVEDKEMTVVNAVVRSITARYEERIAELEQQLAKK